MHVCCNDSYCPLYVASVVLNNSSWSEDGRKQVNKVKGKKERKESQEKEKCRKAGKGEGFYTLPVTKY